MTAEYIGLKRNMTVEQAFAYIRENGVDKGDHLYLLCDGQQALSPGRGDGEGSAHEPLRHNHKGHHG